MGIEIRPEPLGSSVAQTLILALNRELAEMYPEEGANHFRLDEAEVAPGRGVFLIAFDGAEPIGCGALRVLESEAARPFPNEKTGEIKRMFMRRAARGRGTGRAMLETIEAEARKLGVTRLVLETGVRQVEALGLYERAGYASIPLYGEYEDSPLSYCMGKSL